MLWGGGGRHGERDIITSLCPGGDLVPGGGGGVVGEGQSEFFYVFIRLLWFEIALTSLVAISKLKKSLGFPLLMAQVA